MKREMRDQKDDYDILENKFLDQTQMIQKGNFCTSPELIKEIKDRENDIQILKNNNLEQSEYLKALKAEKYKFERDLQKMSRGKYKYDNFQ